MVESNKIETLCFMIMTAEGSPLKILSDKVDQVKNVTLKIFACGEARRSMDYKDWRRWRWWSCWD